MAAPQKAAMPPDVDIGASWVVEFAAVDATTGLDVGGVVVSKAVLEAKNISGGDLTSGIFHPILLRQAGAA